jgi:hypothetical protein
LYFAETEGLEVLVLLQVLEFPSFQRVVDKFHLKIGGKYPQKVRQVRQVLKLTQVAFVQSQNYQVFILF